MNRVLSICPKRNKNLKVYASLQLTDSTSLRCLCCLEKFSLLSVIHMHRGWGRGRGVCEEEGEMKSGLPEDPL